MSPRLVCIAACVLGTFAQGFAAAPPLDGIVLVISDGTSQELLTAARIYSKGVKGHLSFESLPQSAIVRTYSLSDCVTDSGAAATAMARGIKADNRVVGMAEPNAKTSPPSLLDLARKAGWSTGIVTDDSVTGATEAPFLLEHGNRNEEAIIAAKTLEALGPRADIVLGGGAQWFADLSKRPGVAYKPGDLKVVQSTQARLAKANVAAFTDWGAFSAHVAKGGDGRPVLGTFYPYVFPFYADGPRTPRLADLAAAAVKFLSAKKRPFFLMVEAALPDKACHLGNAKRAVVEVGELDNMLQTLRQSLPPRTLLLVTTDHNNGGLAINGPPVPLATRGDALLGPNPITNAKSILTWGTGTGANMDKANTRERTIPGPGKPAQVVKEHKTPADPDYVQPAAVESGATEHTGGDVWLLADGPGSERVHGYLDNTDIYRLIADAIADAIAAQPRQPR